MIFSIDFDFIIDLKSCVYDHYFLENYIFLKLFYTDTDTINFNFCSF